VRAVHGMTSSVFNVKFNFDLDRVALMFAVLG
jgi:hypothetical protein